MTDTSFEMTMPELRNEIIKFNNDSTAQRLRSYYYEKTYPEILGVSRRELCHSSFLAWIFDPEECHGLGHFGVRRLIEILMNSRFWQADNGHQTDFDNIITGNFKLTKTLVQREVSIGSSGRVDILIELWFCIGEKDFQLRIVVENKVLSNEVNDQTNSYFNHFTTLNSDNFTNLFVFLTSISTLDLKELSEPECNNKKFIQINYQELVDSLFEPALDQSINANNKLIIGQYIQSLGQPSMDEEENNFDRGMIMAIGKEERELLQKFWLGNQKIIQAALYAISSDPNQDEDVRDSVGQALSSIATTGRDRSTITIRFDGIDHNVQIKKSDLGYSTLLLLEKLGLIDDEVFNWLAEDTSCGFKLLKTKDEVKENEAKYRKYRIWQMPEFFYKNQGYYVARNWGIGNINKLIEKIQAKFPKIKYVVETRA